MASNNGGGPSPWGNPGNDPGERPGERGERGPGPQRGPWGPGGRGPGGRGGGPGGGSGGGPGGPPDLDELLARLQRALRGILPPGFGGTPRRGGGRGPGGFSGVRGLAILVVVAAGVWLSTGFYRVQPDEQGVVLRFGAFNRTTLPGLNYHLPWPIEAVETPAVTRINRVEVGYRSPVTDRNVQAGRDTIRELPEESLMLTGDENIIDIDCAVFWRIRDAGAFLFDTRNPGYTVKSASESVLREVIGSTPIQPALTDARARIEASVLKGVQSIMDQYGSGVEITQVQLQKVDPPNAVIDSFRDVQRANTDAERVRNEAESYRNDIVPRARGDAARVVAEADGARQASVAESNGQAQRFLSVLKAYDAAKDVTMQRLYLETMQDILTHTPAIVVDDKLQGLVPYLPINPPPLPPGGLPGPSTGQPAGSSAPQAPARTSAR